MAILWVMALALAVAGRGRSHETYWHSWIVANIILSAALAVYVYEWHLPRLLAAALPNGLLLAGFGLRWRAAREFSGRPAPALLGWCSPICSTARGSSRLCSNIATARMSSSGCGPACSSRARSICSTSSASASA